MLNNVKKLDNYFRNYDEEKVRIHLIFLTLIIGLVAQVYSYSNELIFMPNFGDPASRLDSSRRFYDSMTPGIWNQIGTVWLPAHMILLIPFTWISILWETGIAGCIIGYMSYTIAAIVVYKTIYLITKDKLSSIIGWAVYALNPNILFLQTTAMSEPVFFMFILLALYYLVKLTDSHNDMDMLKSSFFMMCSVATRYESWFILGVTAVFIFYYYFKRKNYPIKHSIIFVSVSAAFIGYWLYHNWTRYGDPLEFQRGKYSLLHHANAFLKANLLPTKDNLFLSFDFYNKSLFLNMGYFIVFLFLLGLIAYFIKYKFKSDALFPYILLIIYPFSVYSLFVGQNVMLLPNTEPSGFVHSRYGLAMLPAMSIFSGFFYAFAKESKFVKPFEFRKYFLGAFILFIFVSQISFWSAYFPQHISSLSELDYGSREMFHKMKSVSEYLAEKYDGGNILMDEVIIRLLPSCLVPYKDRIFPYTWDLGEKTLNNPSYFVRWIIVDKNAVKNNTIALHSDEVYEKIQDNRNFLENFKVVYSKDGIEVYKKR